jgi:hypothetical protein
VLAPAASAGVEFLGSRQDAYVAIMYNCKVKLSISLKISNCLETKIY